MKVTYNFCIQHIHRKHDYHYENSHLAGTAHAAISTYKCDQVLL
jgi:hypothetical protein